jgi:hypothetical protein
MLGMLTEPLAMLGMLTEPPPGPRTGQAAAGTICDTDWKAFAGNDGVSRPDFTTEEPAAEWQPPEALGFMSEATELVLFMEALWRASSATAKGRFRAIEKQSGFGASE